MRWMSVKEIAESLRTGDVWDFELAEVLCARADMSEEWENAAGETIESVLGAAADKLGVDIFSKGEINTNIMSVEEIAEVIRNSDEWDLELAAALCAEADMAEEWENVLKTDDGAFEAVIEAAADKLGVDIY